MKNFVITLRENDKSVKSAETCVKSAAKFGMEVEFYEAFTPKEAPEFITKYGINDTLFNDDIYSREDNARAAFCSHFSLWQFAAENNEDVTIFEHDAVVIDNIPEPPFHGCVSFGRPSYGKFFNPPQFGLQPLVSKQYFPGAHAYRVNSKGAKRFIEEAKLQARPTDLFLNKQAFPWLQEFWPWPVEVRETYSTIQKHEGCLAKHMYNEDYVLEDV